MIALFFHIKISVYSNFNFQYYASYNLHGPIPPIDLHISVSFMYLAPAGICPRFIRPLESCFVNAIFRVQHPSL